MTLTEARKILENYQPHERKVRQALSMAVSILPIDVTPSVDRRLDQLVDKVSRAKYGFNPFRFKSRTNTYANWRTCIYYQLILEGYSAKSISRVTGYNHATIITNVKRFKGWLDIKDITAMRVWKEFLEILSEDGRRQS